MSLSCSCDHDDFAWFYWHPDDFSTLKTSKRKRCCSCKTLIDIGATVLEFPRFRHPLTDVEERIYGDGGEIGLSTFYMCESCGDQFFNLSGLGFCIDIENNMFDLLRERVEVYGK